MQHYYSTSEMDKGLAGEGYSPAEGSWVTGERLIFGLIKIPAGTRSKPHSHPNEQHSYILQGKIHLNVEGNEHTLGKGCISYRPANVVHAAEVEEGEDYVFVTVKDTSWGIQGTPASSNTSGNAPKDDSVRYFYNTRDMENRLAGEKYSSAVGKWEEGERIIFGEIVMPADTKADPHKHPNEQFIFVLGGKVDMDIEGDVHTCVPGDIIHIPANAVHSAKVVGGEDYRFITAKDTSWGIQGMRADEA